jgi:hypothetical protein
VALAHEHLSLTIVRKLASIALFAKDRAEKSVAQSVVKIAQSLSFISASFFFSRASDERRSYGNVLPTLVYQLGKSKQLRPAVESDDDIRVRSVRIQAQRLLQDVLASPPSDFPPCVLIVVDALDECKEDAKQTHDGELIPVLLALLKDVPFVRLFLTSRRESSIERLFSRKTAFEATRAFVLHRDNAKRYLRDELLQLKEDVIDDVEFPPTSRFARWLSKPTACLSMHALHWSSAPDGQPERRIIALIGAKPGSSSR